jgi:hypothetical protein
LTASLIGQVIGVAGFGGVNFSAGSHGSAHAFAVTTMALGGTLMGVAVCAYLAHKAPHWT